MILKVELENLIIKKQIWAVSHPERFYPEINDDWQREMMDK